jgi:hypothetical protein
MNIFDEVFAIRILSPLTLLLISNTHDSVTAGIALRLLRCVPEVDLIVDIVASVGIRWHLRRVDRASDLCRTWEEKVGRNDIIWAPKRSPAEERVKYTQRPADTLSSVFLRSTKRNGCNGIQALVHVAKNSRWAEVGRTKLADAWENDVARINACEPFSQGLDSTIWGRATVPILGPPLRDVLELSGALVVLCANDAHNAFVVGNAARTICTVGEECRVEREGDDADNLREREVIDVRVIFLGERRTAGVMGTHDIHGKLLLRIILSEVDHLLHETG